MPGQTNEGTASLDWPGLFGLEEGDRTGVAWLHDGCGQCENCMTGWDSLCYALHKPSASICMANVFRRSSSLCTRVGALDRARREGQMGDINSKIAGLWARILHAAVYPLTMAALLLVTGCSALAQENRGTEEQRVACTPDVLRLCSWDIPNVDRIVACLRREKSQLSAGCRLALKIEATASRAPLNNGAEPRHAARRRWGHYRSPRDYEKSDIRE